MGVASRATVLARVLLIALPLIGCGGGEDGDDAGDDDSNLPRPADPCIAAGTCPPGTWINVSPQGVEIPEYGFGPVVTDPARPSDLYVGGSDAGVFKSTDYGNTWTLINSDIPYVPLGVVVAVAPTTPATVIIAGYKKSYKSIDGGASFTEIPNDLPDSLYSIVVDPNDPTHLISGLHEVDGIVESTDSGETWEYVGTSGFPTGGKSWYPFFIDTGSASTTRSTWLAIAQDGGSVTTTTNGGDSWSIPEGIDGLKHAHGNAQIFQDGDTIIVPGIEGPGSGVYRSDDRGESFERILDGSFSVVWGTDVRAYAMWGWACANCDLGAAFRTTELPDTATWASPEVPEDLNIGASVVAVTRDNTHTVFVGSMWSTGLWRYIEP